MTIASVVRRTHAHDEHHRLVDLSREKDLEHLRELMAHHLEESKPTCLEAVRSQMQPQSK
jgi:DNA-binding GntR family transcriptional regulator